MTLKDYLAAQSETVEDFAARVDASPGMIHKIVYRTRQPSLDLASRIDAATSGQVGAFDMLLPPMANRAVRSPCADAAA